VAQSFFDYCRVDRMAENLMGCCMINKIYSSLTPCFCLEVFPGFDILAQNNAVPSQSVKTFSWGTCHGNDKGSMRRMEDARTSGLLCVQGR
jgi:hypothetical protein